MATASRTVHSTAIAATLEEEIVTGRLNAGSRLDEASLTKRFGVSRTPVREALHTLVSRSLAERIPFRGVIVVDTTPERVEQMFEAMGEMEALCGRLASERMKMRERTQLEEYVSRLGAISAQGDAEGYEIANAQFHELIYAGAHNKDLEEVSTALRLKLAPFRKSQLRSTERMHRSNEEHEVIVAAILDRDPEGAARALRRHLVSAAREVLRGLREGTGQTAEKGLQGD